MITFMKLGDLPSLVVNFRFSFVALVERHGELNRERDFGTITFNFKRSNGEIRPLTFFAFFQEPQYEEITSMTLIPECLKKEQRKNTIFQN